MMTFKHMIAGGLIVGVGLFISVSAQALAPPFCTPVAAVVTPLETVVKTVTTVINKHLGDRKQRERGYRQELLDLRSLGGQDVSTVATRDTAIPNLTDVITGQADQPVDAEGNLLETTTAEGGESTTAAATTTVAARPVSALRADIQSRYISKAGTLSALAMEKNNQNYMDQQNTIEQAAWVLILKNKLTELNSAIAELDSIQNEMRSNKASTDLIAGDDVTADPEFNRYMKLNATNRLIQSRLLTLQQQVLAVRLRGKAYKGLRTQRNIVNPLPVAQ